MRQTQKNKPIIDATETVLAGHYGFIAEELDFMITYDIKHGLGLACNAANEGKEE